jgi:hypothetical protein
MPSPPSSFRVQMSFQARRHRLFEFVSSLTPVHQKFLIIFCGGSAASIGHAATGWRDALPLGFTAGGVILCSLPCFAFLPRYPLPVRITPHVPAVILTTWIQHQGIHYVQNTTPSGSCGNSCGHLIRSGENKSFPQAYLKLMIIHKQ